MIGIDPADHPSHALQRAGLQCERLESLGIDWAGQHQTGADGADEAIGPVVARRPNDHADPVRLAPRLGQAVVHQRLADAAALQLGLDRERAEQDRRRALDLDRPEAQRGEQRTLRVERHEGQVLEIVDALAQAIDRFAVTIGPKGPIQEVIEQVPVVRLLGLNLKCDHVSGPIGRIGSRL